MLDKKLHSHIDEMDILEQKAQEQMDKLISSIDIDEVIDDPHGAMQDLIEEAKNILINSFIEDAAKNGFDLASLLNRYDSQGKEILIDPSKDPKENEDIVQ